MTTPVHPIGYLIPQRGVRLSRPAQAYEAEGGRGRRAGVR